MNLISKSGTNPFHGSVFEFNRNDAYDARSYFQTSIPELRQNQFGYVLGGPIWIPKVYDGRNKSFFLANYEGWRIVNGSNDYSFVPDPTNSPAISPTADCPPTAAQHAPRRYRATILACRLIRRRACRFLGP